MAGKPKPQVTLHIRLGGRPYVTYGLLAALVTGYLLTLLIPTLAADGAVLTDAVLRRGEYHRLFTASFLHNNPAHLAVNLFVLFLFGTEQERIFGSTRFAVLTLLGGLASPVAGALLAQGAQILGASGLVCALLAAELVYLYQHRKLLGAKGRARRGRVLAFLGLTLVIGVFFSAGNYFAVLANWSPLAGILGGGALGWFLVPYFTLVRHPDGSPNDVQAQDVNPFGGRRSATVVSLYLTALMLVLIAGVYLI